MYIKNFDKWNIRKKRIEKKTQIPFFYTREIWRCSLGVNIGSEHDGKNDLYERPVLILKKFNKNTLLILPLTTKIAHKNYSSKELLFNHHQTFYYACNQVKTPQKWGFYYKT